MVARGIGVLIQARKYFNNDYMIILYKAFICPYLMYCIQIWGNIYRRNLSKLQVLRLKAARRVTGSSRWSNIENIYRCNGILNLDFTNTYLVGKFMYRVYHKDAPAILMIFSGTITIYMITTEGQPTICLCCLLAQICLKLESVIKKL